MSQWTYPRAPSSSCSRSIRATTLTTRTGPGCTLHSLARRWISWPAEELLTKSWRSYAVLDQSKTGPRPAASHSQGPAPSQNGRRVLHRRVKNARRRIYRAVGDIPTVRKAISIPEALSRAQERSFLERAASQGAHGGGRTTPMPILGAFAGRDRNARCQDARSADRHHERRRVPQRCMYLALPADGDGG